MTGSALAVLLLGLLLGLAAGGAVGVLLSRTELARRRAETAQAQAVTEAVRAESERFRADAAEARTEAAVVAGVRAQLAAMTAERDAARERSVAVAADRESLVAQFRALSGETAERQGRAIDTVTAQRLQATEQLLAPVTATLQRFETRLTEVEKERVAMSTDLRAHVRAVRDTGEALRRETQALVTALRKPQVRGAWGETQLRRVAELAGMVDRCDFDLQVTSSGAGQADGSVLRPDMRVNLAGGKHVLVDSKVPLSAFLDAAEAADETQRTHHLQRFAKHVRKHVDDLSGKQYWKLAESPEFVVLFLPSEAFFVAALEQLPDLYEYAAARDVVLATPTTLIAMLRAIAYGWKQVSLAETAAEVARLGRELHERLGTMGNRFDKLGRALRTSVNAYNETIATVEGRVLVQARKFRDLKVTEAELAAPTQVDDAVRQIQAPELVDDATRVEPLVGRRRRGALPEADTLFRADPGIDDLVADLEPEAHLEGPDDARETGS